MAPPDPQRWTFTISTPGGDVHASYRLSAERLDFESDALWDGGHVSLPWSAIVEAGTAVLGLPVGPGAPDLGRYVPKQLEWLVASRTDQSKQPFMRPLPPTPDREALLASVRERIGARWIGESLPLAEARQRFGLPHGGAGDHVKAAGIVVGVLALLFLLLLLLVLLLSPIVLFPAGVALGAWLFWSGLAGLRDARSVANTPAARVASAAMGLVEIEGRAQSARPSAAGVSGRPSVWWDVTIEAWSRDSDGGGNWGQLAARHGGTIDVFEVEDDTGRLPVWVKDATLLLTRETWEQGKQPLPPAGAALMHELGFAWHGAIRARETRLELNAPVYVLGTLDQRQTIPAAGHEGVVARVAGAIRRGEWRGELVRHLPRPLGMLVAVLFGFLSILFGVGRGGQRVKDARDSLPPDLPPHAVLMWKGRAGRPFIIANQRGGEAIADLRTRSLYRAGAGVAVWGYVLYELFQLV